MARQKTAYTKPFYRSRASHKNYLFCFEWLSLFFFKSSTSRLLPSNQKGNLRLSQPLEKIMQTVTLEISRAHPLSSRSRQREKLALQLPQKALTSRRSLLFFIRGTESPSVTPNFPAKNPATCPPPFCQGYTWEMAAPFMPSPLDCIGRQRFGFYPAIENAGPNEWLLGAGSRSEVQAINAQTGVEIWIARQYIGAVSDHTNVLTVGLRKALEFREGELQPRVKRVIEMPQAAAGFSRARIEQGPASVVAIRLDDGRKSHVSKAVVGIAVGGLLLALLAWFESAVRF
jgi:hypothetical protein